MFKSKILRYLILFSLIGVSFFIAYDSIEKSLEKKNSLIHVYYQRENSGKLEVPEFWIDCEQSTPYWEKDGFLGAQYDFILYNFLEYDICDWRINIKLPEGSYIDSSWNCFYHLENDTLFISPVEYNEILKKEAYPIGFVIYIPKEAEGWRSETIAMPYKQYLSIQDLKAFWIYIVSAIVVGIAVICNIGFGIRMTQLKKQHLIYKDIVEQALSTFANAIDAKDTYTEGHSRRVALFSREMARRMGWSFEDQEELFYIAMMHDIGKIGIPDRVLNKPTKLNDEEWEIMKRHPIYSGDILQEFTTIPAMSEAVRYHHEWYDGTGYPYKLKGEEIPLISRIITVADSFDTMDSKRVYREPLSMEEIVKQLKENAGKQFDPEIVPYMIKMIEDGAVYRLKELV